MRTKRERGYDHQEQVCVLLRLEVASMVAVRTQCENERVTADQANSRTYITLGKTNGCTDRLNGVLERKLKCTGTVVVSVGVFRLLKGALFQRVMPLVSSHASQPFLHPFQTQESHRNSQKEYSMDRRVLQALGIGRRRPLIRCHMVGKRAVRESMRKFSQNGVMDYS